jgi:FPC/CPF motif-containing protein YcgG
VSSPPARDQPPGPAATDPAREPVEPLADVLGERASAGLEDATRAEVVAAISAMVAHPEYPCLGARSVFRREAVTAVVLDDLSDGSPGGSLDQLGAALRRYVLDVDADGDLVSFVACFRAPAIDDERSFEAALWAALQHLHDHDDHPWAPGVAADPGNPHFAFSVAGTAFFVVGLHPAASRIARRAPLPTLVFNLHEQFERMRSDGSFDRMRDTIRRRDTELQGSPNPMAVDHGSSSEALQYSGRAVATGWTAPFSPGHQPGDSPQDPPHPEDT